MHTTQHMFGLFAEYMEQNSVLSCRHTGPFNNPCLAYLLNTVQHYADVSCRVAGALNTPVWCICLHHAEDSVLSCICTGALHYIAVAELCAAHSLHALFQTASASGLCQSTARSVYICTLQPSVRLQIQKFMCAVN